MMADSSMTVEQKKLVKRYLVWCYKTTKEELDRVDRKFTQLKVDYFLLKYLKKQQASIKEKHHVSLGGKIDEFKEYINKKEESVKEQKSTDSKVMPEEQYFYLKQRLAGIEESIKEFLGQKELSAIQNLYQEEMINRILQAREH